MRGSGYAIGEILIFLAIAAIIGFLIGWLVFYRRPDKGTSQLSPVNPNHVRRLEERSKAVDAKLGRIEKRANALLALLAKAPSPRAGDGTADTQPPLPDPDRVIAPAAAAPAGADRPGEADKAAAPGDEAKDADAAEADEAEAAAAPEGEGASEEMAEEAEAVGEETKEAEAVAEEVKEDAAAAKDSPGADVDDYLSEADDRINKLEETLDKLGEKLAELEDD